MLTFVGKSRNLAPLIYRFHDAPGPYNRFYAKMTNLKTLALGCIVCLNTFTAPGKVPLCPGWLAALKQSCISLIKSMN